MPCHCWSHAAINRASPVAPEAAEGKKEAFLVPSEGACSCWYLSFELLSSRTMRQCISVLCHPVYGILLQQSYQINIRVFLKIIIIKIKRLLIKTPNLFWTTQGFFIYKFCVLLPLFTCWHFDPYKEESMGYSNNVWHSGNPCGVYIQNKIAKYKPNMWDGIMYNKNFSQILSLLMTPILSGRK